MVQYIPVYADSDFLSKSGKRKDNFNQDAAFAHLLPSHLNTSSW